jgi:hypothetical protein
MSTPEDNKARLDALEAQEFWIDFHEWELEELLKTLDQEGEEDGFDDA